VPTIPQGNEDGNDDTAYCPPREISFKNIQAIAKKHKGNECHHELDYVFSVPCHNENIFAKTEHGSRISE
jgi:hypothetical protein